MTNYRIFLLSFVTVSWVFLNGFNNTVENKLLTEETQKTEAELKAIETEKNKQELLEIEQIKSKGKVRAVKAPLQKAKQTTINATDADVADDNHPINNNEFEKTLDLSIPFKTTENSSLKVEQKAAAQGRENNIFAAETKKKPRKLELDGDFLMSPEPEAEKQKSVDGAGIVIKLKP
jgi:hypothetical protein